MHATANQQNQTGHPNMIHRAIYVVLFVLLGWLALSVRAAESTGQTGQTGQPFVTPAKEQILRSLIPDPELAKHPRLILYTEHERPKVYQFAMNGAPLTWHSAYNNLSMGVEDGTEPYGNANREFPWNKAAGCDNCDNCGSFTFLLLPVDSAGQPKPIVWYRAPVRNDVRSYSQGYKWVYPVGSVTGEVLTLKNTRGEHRAFEMRLRERAEDHWESSLFKPFPTTWHLTQAIKSVREDWAERPDCLALVQYCEADQNLPTIEIRDSHPNPAFHVTASIDKLPAIDPETVELLLTSFAFDEATGTTWRGDDCFAPTTDADYHIVPKGYLGTIAGSSSESCMKCHRTAGMHARQFDLIRDWYGTIRGDDGVFSISPVDMRSVNPSGYEQPPRMLQIAGVFEQFDPAKHSRDDYREMKQ